MKLNYKLSIPFENVAEKIKTRLNGIDEINAKIVKTTSPLRISIEIEIPDNSTYQNALEIGALCGAIEK